VVLSGEFEMWEKSVLIYSKTLPQCLSLERRKKYTTLAARLTVGSKVEVGDH
jgi:hypothetical protein